jgi:hypothetical protein
MEHPADQLRDAIEAFRHDETMERARRWRDVDGAESEAAVASRHRRLADVDRARALLDEAVEAGIDETSAAALRAHVARAAADVKLAAGRDALERAARARLRFGREAGSVDDALGALGSDDPERARMAAGALSDLADRIGLTLAQAKEASDEVGLSVFRGGDRPPDAGPAGPALVELAESLIVSTEDVAHEARGWLAPPERSAHALLSRLAQQEAARFAPPRDRYRRWSNGISALGFERDLAARVRVAGTHPFPGPRARILFARVPGDLRIFEAPREWGVASELAAGAALGRALAHALTTPALPLEHRRPLAATVARGVGVILAQLLADRVYLVRSRGLTGADADRLGRAAGAMLLLSARCRAAAVVARGGSRNVGELEENAAAALSRALGADVSIALARLAVVTPAASGPRFRATLHGMSIAWQMRERFDEDWFMNPKVAEPLRAATAQGGLLAIEELSESLGATPDLAPKRLAELFG